jgi:hypothetical protein
LARHELRGVVFAGPPRPAAPLTSCAAIAALRMD